MEDKNLLFNNLNGSLQEALTGLRDLKLSDVEKLMSDGTVLEPIIVFKEGSYASVNRQGKPVTLDVNKERLEKWAANTMRDIPFNIDHKREAGANNYGWLRTKTGSTYVAQDARDGKWALFAQPEFTDELYNQIKSGRFRDVSLEIDVTDDILVGIAVTNYPRIKTLSQFNDIVPEVVTPVIGDSLDGLANLELFNEEKNMEELSSMKAMLEQMKLDAEKRDADNAKIVAALEGKLEEERVAKEKLARAKEESDRKAARARTILDFSEKVDKMVLNEKGETLIPAGIREDVVELFAFLADHNEVALFSDLDADKQVDPVALFSRILEANAKFQNVMNNTNIRAGVEDAGAQLDRETPTGVGDSLREIFRAKAQK